jgi:hypothetical protein
MSIKATAQVAAATAAVLVGALCIPGVAYASDHHSHHHGSYASDRDHDGDNGDDGDDGDKKDHDSKAEIAGIDLGQVTDAVSDLLNSLGDIL